MINESLVLVSTEIEGEASVSSTVGNIVVQYADFNSIGAPSHLNDVLFVSRETLTAILSFRTPWYSSVIKDPLNALMVS